MKKLILFITFALLLTSCEQSLIQKERKAARQKTKVNKELVKTPVEQQTSTVYYEPAPLSDDGNSYWFVLVEEKDGNQRMNTIVKQNHRWFSMKEAKATFNSDVFIINFIQVSRETYENN